MLRHVPLIASALVAAALASCGSPGALIVEQFRAPPRWNDLSGEPVALSVRAAHLDTRDSATYVSPRSLGDFDLLTDVAFLSVASRGLAGVFARARSASRDAPDAFCCLAARPTGHFRVYRSDDPLQPVGGSGWQSIEGRAPAGFLRLGLRRRAGRIIFLLDDVPVGDYALDGPVAGSRDGSVRPPAQASGGPRGLQVGIFSDGVSCRWKHFLAADVTAGRAVALEDLLYWGDAGTAGIVAAECRERLDDVLERPSQSRLFGLIAAFEEGRLAFRQAGLPERERALVELLAGERIALRGAAARADALASYRHALQPVLEADADESESPEEKDLVRRAEEAALDRPARAAVLYAAAQEIRETEERARRIEALLGRLRPLEFAFALDRSGADGVFDEAGIWNVVREDYGALPRADDGALSLHVTVRISVYSGSESARRSVPVRVRDARRLEQLESTVRDLKNQLREDALDAQARANIAERAAAGGAPSSPMGQFRIEGRSLQLLENDGEELQRLESRLVEAQSELTRLTESQRLEFHTVDATLITDSCSAEVSFRLSLDGREILKVAGEKTYLGLEQWRHEARPELGIEAATPSRHRVEATRATVARRALGRLGTAVSLDNVLARLPQERRLDFLLRLARSSRHDDHRDRFLWEVRNELAIRGTALRRIGDRLLD